MQDVQEKESLEEVAADILLYFDFMASELPQSPVGKFSAREPEALRYRLRIALKEIK